MINGKPLEKLDLLDDFMINAVVTDPEVGEAFCRKVLSVLLQKEVGRLHIAAQRVIPAPAPGLRGIRMDVEIEETEESAEDTGAMPVRNVYDLEPHLQRNLDFPRHNRFYQAKIDSRYMYSGENDFSRLPNLYIITITSYDPFGQDYMMYTVRNSCREIKDLEYDDGLTFIYFYTGGHNGGSSDIQAMLRYFQTSTKENVTNEATREIHEYTSKVKLSPEVRKEFMKFEEIIAYAKAEARNEGLAEGRSEGRKEGRMEGRQEGRQEGLSEGRNEGIDVGKSESIIELLSLHGKVPEKLHEQITSEHDPDKLRQWLINAASAASVAEFVERM